MSHEYNKQLSTKKTQYNKMNCYEVCGLELVRLQNIKLNLNFRFGKINHCVCISLILLVPTLPGLPPPPAVLHISGANSGFYL